MKLLKAEEQNIVSGGNSDASNLGIFAGFLTGIGIAIIGYCYKRQKILSKTGATFLIAGMTISSINNYLNLVDNDTIERSQTKSGTSQERDL